MKIKLPLQDNEYTISSGYKTTFVTELRYPSGFGLYYKIPKKSFLKLKHYYKPYGRAKK